MMGTQIPWFRLGARELRRRVRRARHPYARGLWREALDRAVRLREKQLREVDQ